MRRVPVGSSAVASVGYDARRRALDVEYEGGAVYRYEGVPPEEHAALMRAGSKGAFVNRRVKPRYPFRRLR